MIRQFSLIQVFCLAATSAFSTSPGVLSSQAKDSSSSRRFMKRRDAIQSFFASTASVLIASSPSDAITTEPIQQTNLQNYIYTDKWQGTSLGLLSYQQAAALSSEKKLSSSYAMGRWPDPILRRPASPVPLAMMKNKTENCIIDIANALRRTARENGAVGLAAQQCGIDVSMIFLDDPRLLPSKNIRNGNKINDGGLFLVNPRIIARSSELEMRVWNEECLVLPPTFRATVLRDAVVNVQYENLMGETNEIKLTGELARALQHELDHDGGILIVDHVGLNELESDDMRRIEEQGHNERQVLAYSRFISDPNNDGKDNFLTAMREMIVPSANADTGDDIGNKNRIESTRTSIENKIDTDSTSNNTCDEACMQERKRIIQERRAMMNQSRTNRQRSEVLELSRQRATLYGTNYQGVSCPPGVPCI